MSDKIEIEWSVDDGYAFGGKKTFSVCPEDFDHCDSLEWIIAELDDWVQEEFCQNVSYSCNTETYAAKIKEAIDAK